MKKIICFLLTAVMLLGSLATVASAAYSVRLPFSDTKAGAWYAEYVRYMYSEDLMMGKGGGKFQPNSGMTRAEMATLLSRIVGADTSGRETSAKTFTDIKGTEWHAAAIGWAVDEGILTGYPDGTMKPNKSILRQEIVAIICRFADKLGLVLPSSGAVPEFADRKTIASYAREYVDRLAKAEIIAGDNAGNFNPKKSLTRAEASKIIMMLHQIMVAAADGETPELSYNVDSAEDYKVWGAYQFYYSGTGYCGNMEASLDLTGNIPAMTFEDVVNGDRDAQQGMTDRVGSTATAPWYIGASAYILKVDVAKYPVFSVRIKHNGDDTVKGYVSTYNSKVEFTADAVPAGDGWYDVTVDLDAVGALALRTAESDDRYFRICLYPYGDGETAGETALQYAGFFKTVADAEAFDPADISDYMNTYVPKYELDWRELNDSARSKYEEAMNERIKTIRNAKGIDPATVEGTCYYISSLNGDDSNDGLSPETAWASLTNLYKVIKGPGLIVSNVHKGDAVFFERGSVFNSSEPGCIWNYKDTDAPEYSLSMVDGVTYSAYGEGDKPLFTHALKTGSATGTWKKTQYENVWELDMDLSGQRDIGNIVFRRDGVEGWGIKTVPNYTLDPFMEGNVAENDGMVTNGFGDVFLHGGFALENPGSLSHNLQFLHDLKDQKLYLYCKDGDPAEVFDEIVISGAGDIITWGDDNSSAPSIVDNLAVMYSGFCGIGGAFAKNITIQNCEIGWIGGSLQESNGSTTRFGNAIQNWGSCDGFYVRDCYIYQVFDGSLSTQNSSGVHQHNIEMSGNVLTYSNSPIEIWGGDEYVNIRVHDNYMAYTGYHFGHQRPAKNGSFNSGTGDYLCDGWIMEDNVMMYTALFGHIGWAFSSDYVDTGMTSRNNVYILNSERAYFYRGFEDITVTYNATKQNYIYYPYTERYMQAFANVGAEKGTTFYHYDFDFFDYEEDRVYRFELQY